MSLQSSETRNRVRELSADNRSLISHNEGLKLENEDLRAQIDQLRAVNARQADQIRALEILHDPIFTCFPRLPKELQIRIWQFSTSSRVVGVYKSERNPAAVWRPMSRREKQAPTISRVCQLSRIVFLQEHFCVAHGHQGLPIYANPMIDTIYILTVDPVDYEEHLLYFLQYMRMQKGELKEGEFDRKWGIRDLALPELWLNFIIRTPSKLVVFNKMPKLESVVFLGEIRVDNETPGRVITNTTSTRSLWWEHAMQKIAHSKANAPEDCTKWMDLKITAAWLEYSGNASWDYPISDDRGGLDLFGPANNPDSI